MGQRCCVLVVAAVAAAVVAAPSAIAAPVAPATVVTINAKPPTSTFAVVTYGPGGAAVNVTKNEFYGSMRCRGDVRAQFLVNGVVKYTTPTGHGYPAGAKIHAYFGAGRFPTGAVLSWRWGGGSCAPAGTESWKVPHA